MRPVRRAKQRIVEIRCTMRAVGWAVAGKSQCTELNRLPNSQFARHDSIGRLHPLELTAMVCPYCAAYSCIGMPRPIIHPFGDRQPLGLRFTPSFVIHGERKAQDLVVL